MMLSKRHSSVWNYTKKLCENIRVRLPTKQFRNEGLSHFKMNYGEQGEVTS